MATGYLHSTVNKKAPRELVLEIIGPGKWRNVMYEIVCDHMTIRDSDDGVSLFEEFEYISGSF